MDEQQAIESFLDNRTEEAFCALFVALYGRVRRYFLLRGTDEMTAEDLAQRVLFIVHRKAGEFQDAALFQGWLFAIARNELLQHWRRGQSRIETVELEPMRAVLAERLTIEGDAELRAEFNQWLSMLEPNERELVLLRFVEGLSYEELAEGFGVPLGTVKSRLFAVREKLLRIVEAKPERTPRRQIH